MAWWFGRVAAVACLLFMMPLPTGGTSVAAGEWLPTPNSAPGAVWIGNEALIVGGASAPDFRGELDTILKWAPGQPVTDSGWRLPSPRYNVATAWTGEVVYLVGGFTSNHTTFSSILMLDPTKTDGPVEVANMPKPTYDGGAAWDNGHLYMYGGSYDGRPVTDIYRYTPGGAVTTVGSTEGCTPAGQGVRWMGSAEVPGGAYIVGGADGAVFYATICKLTWTGASATAEKVFTIPSSVFPNGLISNSVVWDGTYLYTIGGGGPNDTHDTIFRYNPATNSGEVTCPGLPAPIRETAAVSPAPGEVAVFGGRDAAGQPVTTVTHLRSLTRGPCAAAAPPPFVGLPAPIRPTGVPIVIHLAPHVTEKVTVSDQVTVTYEAGSKALDVVGSASTELQPERLPIPVPPLPTIATPDIPTVYVQLAVGQASADGQVRIAIQAPISAGPSDVQPVIEYYDGAQWVDLQHDVPASGVVAGAGEPPLRVFDAGYDAATHTAWAIVNHTSTYALGHSSPSSARGGAAAGSSTDLGLVGGLLVVGGVLVLGVGVTLAIVLPGRKGRTPKRR
ncbi:MAG: hypothetical protein V4510_13195 [bacterium]